MYVCLCGLPFCIVQSLSLGVWENLFLPQSEFSSAACNNNNNKITGHELERENQGLYMGVLG